MSLNIIIIQNGIPGEPNVSRDDLELYKTISLIGIDNDGYALTGTTFSWQFISWGQIGPNTEAPTLFGSNTNTASFIPSIYGTYLLKLTLGNGLSKTIAAAIKSDILGLRFPSSKEGGQFPLNWEGETNKSVKYIEGYGFYANVKEEISVLEEKTTPYGADVVLIEGSDGYKKRTSFRGFPTGTTGTDENAIHDNVAEEIYDITEKITTVDEDLLIIEDSSDGCSKKSVKVSSLPTGGGLQYVEETFTNISDTYYQLTYVPSDALLSESNKIIQSFRDGNIMWYDVSLPDINYWYFESSSNRIIFTANVSEYSFCYWTDGTIFS